MFSLPGCREGFGQPRHWGICILSCGDYFLWDVCVADRHLSYHLLTILSPSCLHLTGNFIFICHTRSPNLLFCHACNLKRASVFLNNISGSVALVHSNLQIYFELISAQWVWKWNFQNRFFIIGNLCSNRNRTARDWCHRSGPTLVRLSIWVPPTELKMATKCPIFLTLFFLAAQRTLGYRAASRSNL